jgi:hypothetical protein
VAEAKGNLTPSFYAPPALRTALLDALHLALGRAPTACELRLTLHVARTVGSFDIPLPWDALAKDAPYARLSTLERAGLLSVTGHAEGRCTYAEASPSLREALLDALHAARSDGFVDALTGERRKGRRPRNQSHGTGRNALPEPMLAAMKALQRGLVNVEAFQAHLDALWAEMKRCEQGTAEWRRAAGALQNDLYAWNAIRERGLTPTDLPHIHVYDLAYRVAGTGRFIGPAQSVSRRGKAAMYSGIEGVRNYDLKASQPRILADELRRARIACPWLDEYLADPEAKTRYAAIVGLSQATWKVSLLSAMFGGLRGGYLIGDGRGVSEAIEAVRAEKGEGESGRATWARVRAELGPLATASAQLARHLSATLPETATKGGGAYVVNAVGAKLYTRGVKATKKGAGCLLAHVLQGREARYIHALCALSERYGFAVLSHEHDGLVTKGDVPPDAMAEAARVAEMGDAELVVKPFV